MTFIEVYHALNELQDDIDNDWWKISEQNAICVKIYRAVQIIWSQIGFELPVDAIERALHAVEQLDEAGRYLTLSSPDTDYEYFFDLYESGRLALNETISILFELGSLDPDPNLVFSLLADFLRQVIK